MADSVTRSIDALQRLYTIVIGLALTEAVRGFLAAPTPAAGISQSTPASLGLLLIMVFTVVPFYHGANNYLDATYIVGQQASPRRYTLLVDFFVLFAQGVFMVMMGLSIANEARFLFLFQALLIIDIGWAVFVYFAVMSEDARRSVVRWSIINVLAVAALFLVRKSPLLAAEDRLTVAVSVAIARTFFDYTFCWDFYLGHRKTQALA